MAFGIVSLSIVPVRAEPSDASEMVSQLLFGESFEILQQREKWIQIRSAHDGYQGWLCSKQWMSVDESVFQNASKKSRICSDLVEVLKFEDPEEQSLICFGALLPGFDIDTGKGRIGDRSYRYSGAVQSSSDQREQIISAAFTYLNAPYLWGGRSPFGIDCSGLTQMAYRFGGVDLPRDAKDQAELGQALSFIEESVAGDLAFFANEEGRIIHVGILLENDRILHASGKVRIDSIDQTGIYNKAENKHTHDLRVIKRIL